jgi:hypothetical protein
MPSFRGKIKPPVPCRRFVACKRTLRFTWKLESAGKIDRPFLAQFRPSLTEVSHIARRGAPLEMTYGTKGGAQRASSLRPRCFGEADPETATHIYIYEVAFKIFRTGAIIYIAVVVARSTGPNRLNCEFQVLLRHFATTV